MRFAIYGSGGVGGYYGACLAKAGHEVLFIARGEHLAAMQSRGLVVESIDGDFSLPEVRAAAGPDSGFIADVVIVGVKAWQIKAMADSLSVMMDENSVVLPLQNGGDASRLLAEGVGTERVMGGLCRIFSRITAPGAIHHFAGKTTIGFGELDGQVTDRCKRLAQVGELGVTGLGVTGLGCDGLLFQTGHLGFTSAGGGDLFFGLCGFALEARDFLLGRRPSLFLGLAGLLLLTGQTRDFSFAGLLLRFRLAGGG